MSTKATSFPYQKENLIKIHGNPIHKFLPIQDSINDEVPIEILIFQTNNHASGLINYSRYGEEDIWLPNLGGRFVIADLLSLEV